MGFKVDFSKLDWGAIDNKPRGRPEDIASISNHTTRMARLLDGHERTSSQGVPHVLVTRGDTTYSVCWFKKPRFWRIFYPFPSWGAPQVRVDCYSDEEVVKYFADLH